MTVVDASAVVDLLLRLASYDRIQARLARSGESLHAPFLLDAEVLQAVRGYALRRQLSPSRAVEALEDFGELRITRYPHLPLVPRVWELRNNFSAYDALYVGLAEALNAPLVTSDGALARARGHHARLEIYT